MDYFSFTQVCRICKKSSKTFKIYLNNYDDNGRFLKKEEGEEFFSFVCCNITNAINFQEICNPYTIQYLRRVNEIDKRIEQITAELFKIKMEKLKITTCSL